MRKARDRLSAPSDINITLQKSERDKQRTDVIGVIHRKGDASALEIVHVQRSRFAAASGRIHELELARPGRDKVRRAVLVAERVAADDDRLDPPGHGPRNAVEDDRLAEDGAAEDVADLCVCVRVCGVRCAVCGEGEGEGEGSTSAKRRREGGRREGCG